MNNCSNFKGSFQVYTEVRDSLFGIWQNRHATVILSNPPWYQTFTETIILEEMSLYVFIYLSKTVDRTLNQEANKDHDSNNRGNWICRCLS